MFENTNTVYCWLPYLVIRLFLPLFLYLGETYPTKMHDKDGSLATCDSKKVSVVISKYKVLKFMNHNHPFITVNIYPLNRNYQRIHFE